MPLSQWIIPDRIGALIIGDEILLGKRQDRHFKRLLEEVVARGLRLVWVRYVGDDGNALTAEFTQTLAVDHPVMCFGGIGATPDDRTRTALAAAAGVPLTRHPTAAATIEDLFGAAAYPIRIRMAEFPVGSRCIPNPINGIAGFSFRNHHCLPGFPEMAHPMLSRVLDELYPVDRPDKRWMERSVVVRHVGEGDLTPLLEKMEQMHPEVTIFSLPKLGPEREVEIGVRGCPTAMLAAFAEMQCQLQAQGIIPPVG
ncbi:MAG: competence/damage-inducible protein A [Magnetococcales bacterium]|nr:competence/damage-inducible protein A [Magnetococcales bacterium]